MALSLSSIFKQLTGNGTYDPGAQARAALQSSNSSMIKNMFSSQPIVPAKTAAPAAPAQNMSYNTANGLPPSASNPLLNTAPSGGNVQKTPAPGPTGGTSVFSGGPTGSTGPTASAIPQEWINPAGGFYTPDEVAANIAKSAQYGAGPAAGNGDIPQYAGNLLTQGPQSAEQLQAAAAALNNSRNDIAVGATDPYKVGSQSGIAYTPAELDAIEKAYAGIYDPAINTALSKLDAKQKSDAQNSAPYTLGKDDVRYDGEGNVIAVGPSSSTTTGGTYVQGQDPTADAYVKGIQANTLKMTDVPDAYKGLVAQGLANAPKTASAATSQVLTTVNDLLGNTSLSKISGPLDQALGGIFGDAAKAKNQYNQLKALLSLDNIKYLKGTGQISDKEEELLSNAASYINRNLSDDDFKNALIDLRSSIDPSYLSTDEINFLKSQGKSQSDIDDLQESMLKPSVGNTTASTGTGNLPQRNNNPGDVKKGGVADSLATGTDSQGHLIFPDAATGFKALQADLQAKISGNSKYLPANPTISQLAKVYAEDPTWGPKVASLLGVPVTTNTKNIPIAALAQAIATQEGYYA